MRISFIAASALLVLASCSDSFLEDETNVPLPESTTAVAGKQVIKILPHWGGWMALRETAQLQYIITRPLREIAWLNGGFGETSTWRPANDWFLIDAVTHPSGQTTAAIINVDLKRDHFLEIKLVRIGKDGSVLEYPLQPLPVAGERTRYYPGSLDRIRLTALGESVFVVARWEYNEVEASRISFTSNQFHVDWQRLVEPDAYAGTTGIIGGGYDNFRQGDRYFFVYSDIDDDGNLYVAVPSHEDVVMSHDARFGTNLYAQGDPASYDFGAVILTRLSSGGDIQYSTLVGKSRNRRILSMKVGGDKVFLSGRMKTGTDANSWDGWVVSANTADGSMNYESLVDVRDGDMFWDVEPLPGQQLLAVGTTGYTQNPHGLSVSDARSALAVVLDAQGKLVREIELPQGPSERGSEAMFVLLTGSGSAVFAGAHNAPGTHSSVYSDGFIAVRDFSLTE